MNIAIFGKRKKVNYGSEKSMGNTLTFGCRILPCAGVMEKYEQPKMGVVMTLTLENLTAWCLKNRRETWESNGDINC